DHALDGRARDDARRRRRRRDRVGAREPGERPPRPDRAARARGDPDVMRAASRGLAVAFAIAAWWTASAGGLGVALASDEPPRPKAGIVPLELAQVAGASGEDLRIASPAMSLAGKRVRFVGKVAEVSATADGQQVVVVTDGDARVVLRMPGVLEDPSRLDRAKEWEDIARLDRPVGLADGRQAIAVAPD